MEILRYAAFSSDPAGGNPAGVVLDAGDLDDAAMQRIAADVGFSETAFLTPTGPTTARVRYFAPIAEVPFCGHATIASAVARADRGSAGRLQLDSPIGLIEVTTSQTADGIVATLVSVPPEVLDRLDHDQQELTTLMARQGWEATVAVVARTGAATFEARNPFPPGGVREDPATGSAAAALGGYLRALGLVDPPARITVRQGRHVGRPGLLTVDIPAGDGGIAVSGRAVPMRC